MKLKCNWEWLIDNNIIFDILSIIPNYQSLHQEFIERSADLQSELAGQLDLLVEPHEGAEFRILVNQIEIAILVLDLGMSSRN